MPRVQIVIPCYNEEQRFDPDALRRCLQNQPDTSFILVNDGSTDGTLAKLEALAAQHPKRVHVVDQAPNQGKAEAVRRGMLVAITPGVDFAGYWDADLATPLDEIPNFVDAFEKHPDTDIVLGARVAMVGRIIERSALRHYGGRVFATIASTVLDLPVYDTQCGAKLLRCNDTIRSLFEKPFGSRWVFDVEILARYLSGPGTAAGIRELPLERWTDVPGSKVKPLDFFRGVLDLTRIHHRYRLRADGSPSE